MTQLSPTIVSHIAELNLMISGLTPIAISRLAELSVMISGLMALIMIYGLRRLRPVFRIYLALAAFPVLLIVGGILALEVFFMVEVENLTASGTFSFVAKNSILMLLCFIAVVSMIFRAGRLAAGFAALPVVDWILLPILTPMEAQSRFWVVPALETVGALLLLQSILSVIFGREVANGVMIGVILRLLKPIGLGYNRVSRACYALFDYLVHRP